MAVPKKKTSRSRRDRRRHNGFNQLAKQTMVSCPSCNEPKRPHRVCSCGHYDGKHILPVAETV
jgi:large subunit ribosomal protein L32